MIELNICECSCHKKGLDVMHFMPCCELTYEKYISEDGSINVGKRNELLEKLEKKD